MPSREIDSKHEYRRSFPLQNIISNTITKGNTIDSQSSNSAQFTVQSGDITDGSYAFTLEIDANDDQGFSSPLVVPDSDLRGAVAADLVFDNTLDNKLRDVGYVGNKRFVRWSVTSSGVTVGGFFSGTVMQGDLSLAPAFSGPASP